MKRNIWLLIVYSLVSGCTEQAERDNLFDDLYVSWELLENTFTGDQKCSAAFTFINKGVSAIKNRGWIIYFNQSTIMPESMVNPAVGKVEHINGDFYRFLPGKDFLLSPGDTLVFEYSYKGIMMKETDAPNGIYLAQKENSGRCSLMPLKNYTVTPFDNFEKLFPGLVNRIPTPENEYADNLTINELPLNELSPIIPTPFRFIRGAGNVEITGSTIVYYSKDVESEAEYMAETFEKLFGCRLPLKEGAGTGANSIFLKTSDLNVNGISEEAYHLKVSQKEGIMISGSDAAGVFYGIQSLISLVPAEYLSQKSLSLKINSAEILDAPRFHFRGFLLDVSRNFQKKEAVLKLIDLLASYKVNVLNFRLTEDEGWRIEIKGLPELTQTGSRRGHTLDDKDCLPPSFGSGPFPDAEENHGTGFYSRDDFKEILKYASQRHIKIIPEVCFPSHARAAIKSMEVRYSNYLDKGDRHAAEEFRLIDPKDKSSYYSAQLYKDNIACVALESTYHFYETVVHDISEMYREAGVEFTFFHTGGDEVPQGAWAGSPQCRKLMEINPEIKEPGELQAYFFDRVLNMLEKYDLTVGGWEEVVLSRDQRGNISINNAFTERNVIPYVWDNTGDNIDLGYRIANAGYKVILCNVTNLYFDLSYNADPKEPGLYWGGFQDAKDPFVLIPFDVFKSSVYDDFGDIAEKESQYVSKEQLRSENRENIIGLQAQLWTETVKGENMMEYYVLPKLFAFAEKAWAAAPYWEADPDLISRTSSIDRAWNEFANRIGKNEFPRLDYLFGGFNYRIPLPGAVIENGILKANIDYPGLKIRYSTDGSDPSAYSPVYTGPLKVEGPVKLAGFSSKGRSGRTVMVNIKKK